MLARASVATAMAMAMAMAVALAVAVALLLLAENYINCRKTYRENARLLASVKFVAITCTTSDERERGESEPETEPERERANESLSVLTVDPQTRGKLACSCWPKSSQSNMAR